MQKGQATFENCVIVYVCSRVWGAGMGPIEDLGGGGAPIPPQNLHFAHSFRHKRIMQGNGAEQ
jgi:hypothetical protein